MNNNDETFVNRQSNLDEQLVSQLPIKKRIVKKHKKKRAKAAKRPRRTSAKPAPRRRSPSPPTPETVVPETVVPSSPTPPPAVPAPPTPTKSPQLPALAPSVTTSGDEITPLPDSTTTVAEMLCTKQQTKPKTKVNRRRKSSLSSLLGPVEELPRRRCTQTPKNMKEEGSDCEVSLEIQKEKLASENEWFPGAKIGQSCIRGRK